MNLSPALRQRFFDSNGVPLAGGLLYSYQAGTSTPQVTYSNSTGTANTNPVVLDSQGYADVWIDPTLAYKLILQDASNNVLWSVDNVTFPLGIAAWNPNFTYQQGNIVQDTSGQGLLYVSLINNNQGQALTNVSAWRVFAGNVRTVSVATTLVLTDDLVRSNSTSGALTHTLPACSTTPIGKRITIKDVGTGGYTTSIKGSGTDLIDGNNVYVTSLRQYCYATFINNGTSWDAISNNFVAPTVQKFITGSGTYSIPTSPRTPLYIRVRMVGGGGGGAGSGPSAVSGSSGGASTFGASLLSAGGGSGGTAAGAGGIGGTASLGTILSGIAFNGAAGGNTTANIANSGGGAGGASPWGGAGSGDTAGIQIARSAAANSGSGGGGAAISSGSGGGGGGAGGYVEAIITGPAPTYSYTVGGNGGGGAHGTSGDDGGNGAWGLIIVEEYYQ